ncbi:MAG: hypothetical protein OQK12_15465 [Motiliproteus sp.]|nr:hypothetical protein [Motiliproteus sp.]MCW9051298.1 hypothetical protein [Motiliproteus sp.]
MISWHAVIGGSITTVLIVVLKDLIYVLFASLIGAYGNAHPWFVPYMEHIWFFSALLVYCASMILGGAVTMYFDDDKRLSSAFIVGIVASLVAVWSMAAPNTEYNSTSLLFLLVGICAATFGGWWAIRKGKSADLAFPTNAQEQEA